MPSPHLQRKLKDSLGGDAGEELAAVMDRIDPIRGDIAELRHAMEQGFARIEARFAAMDARFSAQEARTDAAIDKSAKEQMRYFFLAWGMLLAAIVGLYGTVVALVR